MSFWQDKKVGVTDGAGFLGFFIVEKLKSLGCKDIFVPTIEEYDLVDIEAVKRLHEDAKSQIVINLVTKVGGIGQGIFKNSGVIY